MYASVYTNRLVHETQLRRAGLCETIVGIANYYGLLIIMEILYIYT